MTSPKTEDLLRIVRSVHPAGVDTEDARYDASCEAQSLSRIIAAQAQVLRQEVVADDDLARLPLATVRMMDQWTRFLTTLETMLPNDDIVDTTIPGHDPCFRCHIYPGGVSPEGGGTEILVSLLAPVYTVVGEALPQHVCELVERVFEASYVADTTLRVLVSDLVPRAGNRALGDAVLGDLLFSPHIASGWSRVT